MARGNVGQIFCLGAIGLALSLALPGFVGAATITPNTTLDQFNSDATQCPLREAV